MDFRDYVQHMLEADKDLLLGYLVWYSVSDVQIPHQEFVNGLLMSGIATDLPKAPSDADIFRRVSTKAERKLIHTHDPDVFENLLVRDLGHDSEKIHRRIVAEQVDAKGKRLNYEQVMDVTFNRKTSHIDYTALPCEHQASQQRAMFVVDAIREGFNNERGTLNSYAVREWIRNFLVGLNATSVRPGSGGVYFVSQSHATLLEKAAAFCSTVPGSVVFHYLPLIDDGMQRDMLRYAYETETFSQVESILAEMEKVKVKGDQVSQAKYESLLAQYHQILARSKEYKDLLEDNVFKTDSQMELLAKALIGFGEKNVKFREVV